MMELIFISAGMITGMFIAAAVLVCLIVHDDRKEDRLKMPESGRCKYCGCKAGKHQRVCAECYKKLILVRKLIAIGKMIKQQAEEEKRDSQGISHAGEETQNPDRAASERT